MADKKLPQCAECLGRNWINLGIIKEATGELPEVRLWQCGGARAYTDQNEVRQGCKRVIRATLEDMAVARML